VKVDKSKLLYIAYPAAAANKQQQVATINIMITVMNADRFTLSNQNNSIEKN
jgi:hypothetical protein